MTNALDDLTAELEQIKEHSEGEYFDLVRAIAADEKQDAAHVARVLQAFEKTPDDLSLDVRKIVRRRGLQADMAAVPELQRKRDELKAKIEDANAELERAVALHKQTVRPLQHEIQTLNDDIARRGPLKQQLYRECPNPALHSRMQYLQADATRLDREADAERSNVHRLQSQRKPGAKDERLEAAIKRREEVLESIEIKRANCVNDMNELFAQMVAY